EAGEDAQQRGLAGAVRPDQAHDLAGVEREIDRLQHASGAVADRDAARVEAHQSSPRSRQIRSNRNGAPISAVTTPSLSSGRVGMSRTAMSAASSSTAPPSPLTSSSRPGR